MSPAMKLYLYQLDQRFADYRWVYKGQPRTSDRVGKFIKLGS